MTRLPPKDKPTDAMIAAGKTALARFGYPYPPDKAMSAAYTAMNAARTPITSSPKDRDLGTELAEAANLLGASGDYDLRDAVREAASRLTAKLNGEALVEALDDLQQAEFEYRLMHDRHGEGAQATGRAWDLMKRAGDKARAALAERGERRG